MRSIGQQTALDEARALLHSIWSSFTESEDYTLELKQKFGRLDQVVIEIARDGVGALEFVDRLYSTMGLVANSSESGKMIGQVRDTIRSIGGL